ncbi:peptide deformylase [Candidatus Dojkabacteria bacterium]|uniref:Peptide deformylase n=1 Tax=Candidatus Dojkabacteria bacterium TaxID=2099670 RepID=A0A955L9Z3_9BACT|nr:peptide deformylase [Candidatus Dojkabacteria bacterium]
MNKKIIQIGDKRLLQVSEPVEESAINTQEIQSLIKDITDTVKAHEDSAAGLSAVQIGVLKRIFVVKDNDDKKTFFRVFINPEITEQSSETTIEWEGCMSINSNNKKLFGPVERSKQVTFRYLDENGIQREISESNFRSHLLLHELDHLNGKLFLQYVSNPENIWNEDELDDYLDKYQAFPPIK